MDGGGDLNSRSCKKRIRAIWESEAEGPATPPVPLEQKREVERFHVQVKTQGGGYDYIGEKTISSRGYR